MAAALALSALAGCASIGAPPDARALRDYGQLQPQPDGTRAWREPGSRLPATATLDPTAIAVDERVPLDEAERRWLREQLRAALAERLRAAGFRVVDVDDGSEALALRATITSVERAQPALNAVTTVLLFAPLSYGGLSVELEAFDARGGRRVAAMAFAGRAGMQDFGASFSDLGHAKAQALVVANRFAELLGPAAAPQAAHVGTAPRP